MKEFIRTHKAFSFYTSLVLLVVLIALFSPWLTPNDPFASNLSNALKAPSSTHWFGTDKLGRDVLSRIIYGTGLSLFMGFTIVVLEVKTILPFSRAMISPFRIRLPSYSLSRAA